MKLLRILLILPFLITYSAVAADYAKKHTVMADGHPIAVWEKSVDNPKGVILLHHGRTWSSLPDFDLQVDGEDLSLMDGFNERGYSVWAMDARGYGETPRDDTGWNTPNRSSKDISLVIKWLKDRTGDDIHLWGWSMGSMLGHLSAQQYPDNIKSLTLFGYPFPLGATYPEDIPGTEPPREKTTAEAAASDFIVPGSISQKAIDEYVRHSLEADPVRMDWHYQHQYNQVDGTKLPMPVLLLDGEHDPLTHDDAHADLFLKLPNAHKQWVVLKGGDHAALLEKSRNRLIDASVNFMQWIDK
ncbi:alpha/beta hydrolase [Pseudemcibacter aquimaris]|uniref:alpha/beta hydrolase n=1 Tax=Pseudemcibacter aquimaris TaxID=2857064 RepID=UPI002012DF22|nr:alpha/beta fold hydrolase [Pseudemcibacter aquimaris]MCC3860386.1 alpha/beta hydrolase [Pseudemcibacter aquimaris]WDU57712.1 lysophospholipase [Pseudemcibacter aquimaris]